MREDEGDEVMRVVPWIPWVRVHPPLSWTLKALVPT